MLSNRYWPAPSVTTSMREVLSRASSTTCAPGTTACCGSRTVPLIPPPFCAQTTHEASSTSRPPRLSMVRLTTVRLKMARLNMDGLPFRDHAAGHERRRLRFNTQRNSRDGQKNFIRQCRRPLIHQTLQVPEQPPHWRFRHDAPSHLIRD